MERPPTYSLRLVLQAVLLLALGSVQAAAPAPAPSPVRIAAAADLKFALEEVASAFRKAQPGCNLSITYGSSGNFYAQIRSGAPFDLFLSADVEYARRLSEEGLTLGPPFVYAIGRLALCVPSTSGLSLGKTGLAVLRSPDVRKIAIANPRHAPYGRAAEEALRRSGLLDALRDRLVLGENVAQAAQFVEAGSADAALVALSLAVSAPMRSATRCEAVPADLHAPLTQGGVILKGAADQKAAAALRDLLLGAEGRAILARFGFSSTEP